MLLVGRADNNQNKASKYPLSRLSFIAETPFSRQQQTSGFNSLGFGRMDFFSIKQRLLHVARFTYFKNSDPLKKEKNQHSVYRVSAMKQEWVKSVSLSPAMQPLGRWLQGAQWRALSPGQFCSTLFRLQPPLQVCNCSEAKSFPPLVQDTVNST